jgi:hypothetical protein
MMSKVILLTPAFLLRTVFASSLSVCVAMRSLLRRRRR